MPMVPNNFNSVMRPDNLMCVCIDTDPDWGSDGMYTVMIVARPATNIAWNYFGNVWMSTWPETSGRLFGDWYKYTLQLANIRINEVVGDQSAPVSPVVPPGPYPTAWDDVKAWYIKNVKWEVAANGGWNLVPGQQGLDIPVTPPGMSNVYPLFANRVFFAKHAYEYGINADGTPAVRINEWGKGWVDYVPK